jgi:hypothetical protein
MSKRNAKRLAGEILEEFTLDVSEHGDSALESLIDKLSDYLDSEHDEVLPDAGDVDDDDLIRSNPSFDDEDEFRLDDIEEDEELEEDEED